jgi:hypothetical protein
MAFWYDYESRGFDSVNNTFTITTVDDLTYVFDVITGEAIEGEIIITEEVWSPFNFMEEESPVVYPYVLSAEDLEFDHSEYITDQVYIDLPLDDEYITESLITGESQPDILLTIGIVVTGVGIIGIITTLIILKLKKKA